MKSYRAIFLIILSATLLIFSFPELNLWCLAWLAMVPFFLAIRDSSKWINTFLLGFLWGLIFFYGAVYWLNAVAPAATVAVVFYLALYPAVYAVFAGSAIRSNLALFVKAIVIASGWVVLEFARSNLLGGFGWALLGYSQSSFLPAIQIADIAGAWGVSFLLAFANAGIYEFLFNRLMQNRLINLLFSILLIAIIFLYGFYKLSLPPAPLKAGPVAGRTLLKISLIQGNIPQTLKWDESYRRRIIKTYFDLTKQAAGGTPGLVIWPETSFPADFETEPETAKGLFELAKEINAYLLVGANRFVWEENKYACEKIYNSAFLINPDGEISGFYDKLHLVPFGEYIPRVPKILLRFLPEKINLVGDFSPGSEHAVFKLLVTSYQSPVTFSVLICFEDIFPELARQFVKNGAQFLVNITNDGWYGISSAPFQHAQASVFRAVENRVCVVRSANTGHSVFIDENGRIVDGVKPFAAGYKTATMAVNTQPERTFYNRYGDVFAVICILISAAACVILIFYRGAFSVF